MTEDSPDIPRTHNNFVEFVRVNDTSVVASVLEDEYVPKEDLQELVERWEKRADKHRENTLERIGSTAIRECAQELKQVIDDE